VAAAAMLATTAMPGEAAMPREAAMAMRKAVAPPTVIPVAMIPAIGPAVSVSVVAVTNGSVANGLRHASGQGKTDADQQQYGPRQSSTAIHRRLHVLYVIVLTRPMSPSAIYILS
jgi:hypothetical protein